MYRLPYEDGSEYIEFGTYLENTLDNHLLYKDNVPLGSFAITTGIFIILSALLSRFFFPRTLSPNG
jgi:hypothetical protein